MRSLKFVIATIFVLVSNLMSAQSAASDSVEVRAFQKGDGIVFQLTAYQIETQLTFLMQGLSIAVIQTDTLVMSFPSADMVRHKVRRHPNEVKAVLEKQRKLLLGKDSIHHVVRPDVQPLVAALNDTTAIIRFQDNKVATRDYKIELNREDAIMTFSFLLQKNFVSSIDGLVNVSLFSAPSGRSDRAEFTGTRLSGENSPRRNGLGEGIRKEDVFKRTYQKSLIIKVEIADKE